MQTVFNQLIKYNKWLFDSLKEDNVRFMFLKPLMLILTYCKRKTTDKFEL